MNKVIHAAAIAASVAAIAAAGHVDSAHADSSAVQVTRLDVVPAWVLRPCKTEDSVNCAWNAATQGNGRGHSFVVRLVPGKAHMVCVFYAAPRYAASHDYCEATR